MNGDEDIFADAISLPAAEREAFLVTACQGDAAQLARVVALLCGHDRAPEVLKLPLAARPDWVPEDGIGDSIGRYKLLQKIGEGGMGVVYLAGQNEPVRRRVALKIIKLGMDTKAVVARFEAERQALAVMDHPNIAKVLDGGATDAGRPYFVMELVSGVKITEYCDEARLSTRERLDLFVKVCQAIQHAHQKGIIHRDIKPSNILVTDNDGVAVPKVIDFGIAKATEGRLTDNAIITQFEALIGTPAYMSPEQAVMTSVDVDTRCDIYSLGVLLYELLAGRTPFDAKELLASGLDEMRKILREQEPIRPSTRLATLQGEELSTTAKRRSAETAKLLHQLHGDLDWIVMKCLEKDRARRYETANGLATDIQRHLNNEPVVARPPSAVYRFQKMVRRNRLAFAAACAVTLTLIAGLGFSTWSLLREREARVSEGVQRRIAVDQQTKAERAQGAEKQERLRADAEKTTAERHLYVASMNLAQQASERNEQAWEQNNTGRLRQLLEETRESPYRGFEWYYWQRQTHQALETLRGHGDWIISVAFSPDSRRIVTASVDKTTKVWDAATGREMFPLKGHGDKVYAVAYSPDGRQIVTGSYDNTAKVWDAATGTVRHTLEGHRTWVRCVAFSPDSQRIVTGSWDKTAKVWDAVSGRELLTFKEHTAVIRSAAFSPDNIRIVTGGDDDTAKIWNAVDGGNVQNLAGHTDNIWAVAFSPDGHRIVTGSYDKTARVWDVTTGREQITFKGHTDWVLSAAFSADGQRVVTGGADQVARIWDVSTGTSLFTLSGHSGQIYAAVFSPDGQWIATGSADHTAKLWRASRGGGPLTFSGHNDMVTSASISGDGRRIVTGSDDRTARVWDADNGRELLRLDGHGARIYSAGFSPDGRRIVTGSEDHTAKVWDSAKATNQLTLVGHRAPIWSAVFSPDNQWIVTGSGDRTARVWDAATGQQRFALQGHSAHVYAVGVSPDGRLIVTGGADRTAKVWDAAGGRELRTLTGHRAWLGAVAFSPDGLRIVTGSYDRTAKVWETSTGREQLTLEGHSAPIWSVGFSPDGQRIVSSSADQTAKVWEAAGGRELLTLKGHSAGVRAAVFSRDGQGIVTAGDDRTAKVWRAARAEEVATWQAEERAAAEQSAVMQRKRTDEQEFQRRARAADEGSIKRWLVLAPIELVAGQSAVDVLDAEQVADESRLRPKAGDSAFTGSTELKWQEVVLDDYVIDFDALLRRQLTPRSVAYAVCYIRSQAERRGLQMVVSSDREAKVFLNGKQVHKSVFARRMGVDLETVPDIALQAGLNVLVFKVVKEVALWQGSIRFTDAKGDPIKGIAVTLEP